MLFRSPVSPKGDARQTREYLARAKAYFHRHDVPRALAATAAGVQGIVDGGFAGRDLTELHGALREMVQMLSRDEDVKTRAAAISPRGLVFEKGTEKQLLAVLARILRSMRDEQEQETYEQAIARKQQLDKLLLHGKRLLEHKKVAEADEAFTEATGHYRNEHRLFLLMGKAMLEAGEPKRALRHLRKAMEVDPDKAQARRVHDTALARSKGLPDPE